MSISATKQKAKQGLLSAKRTGELEMLAAELEMTPPPMTLHGFLGVAASALDERTGLADAGTYLQKHDVRRTLLTAMGSILSEKPPDVRAFLIAHLEKAQGAKPRTLFTTEDLECMFDMYNTLGAEAIPALHLREALALVRPDGLMDD